VKAAGEDKAEERLLILIDIERLMAGAEMGLVEAPLAHTNEARRGAR
jgi:hypothetical protein